MAGKTGLLTVTQWNKQKSRKKRPEGRFLVLVVELSDGAFKVRFDAIFSQLAEVIALLWFYRGKHNLRWNKHGQLKANVYGERAGRQFVLQGGKAACFRPHTVSNMLLKPKQLGAKRVEVDRVSITRYFAIAAANVFGHVPRFKKFWNGACRSRLAHSGFSGATATAKHNRFAFPH